MFSSRSARAGGRRSSPSRIVSPWSGVRFCVPPKLKAWQFPHTASCRTTFTYWQKAGALIRISGASCIKRSSGQATSSPAGFTRNCGNRAGTIVCCEKTKRRPAWSGTSWRIRSALVWSRRAVPVLRIARLSGGSDQGVDRRIRELGAALKGCATDVARQP